MTLLKFCIITFFVVLLLPISGCMLGPDFQTPEAELPENWSELESLTVDAQSEQESVEWWTRFNDPVLNNLIWAAYQQNLSLRTAGLRILEARARLGQTEGNLFPQSQAMTGDLTRISSNGPATDRTYNSAAIGFDAAWEMDFWGKFRRAIESADAGLLAEVANYDDVLVSLTAEVARTYVNIRTLEERISLARKNSENQKDALKLINYQFEAGTVTELDVLQAENLLSTTQSLIPNLQNLLQQNRNALAILLGMPPGTLLDLLTDTSSIPTISGDIAVGIPADLLRRRPDIRKAEMQTAAQSAQVGVAVTELYPSFSLFGSIGWSTSDVGGNSLGDLFDSNSLNYTFGPSFRWNLFNYGQIKNQVRVQDARLEQLITVYQNTVLNAAREVENSVAGLVFAQQEAEFIRKGVVSSERSVELSMLQYSEGFTDYQRVLDSTRALTQKQDQYAQLKGQIATNSIALYKALGGGWQIRLENDFVPREIKDKMQERTDWGDMLKDTAPEDE